MSLRPIRLPTEVAAYLGETREWGLPTLIVRGQTWHSEAQRTISCVLVAGDAEVRVDTRELDITPDGDLWMPRSWHRAMAVYARSEPLSAELQAYASTALSHQQRRAQLVEIAGYIERAFEDFCAETALGSAAGLADLIKAWAGRNASWPT